MGARGGAPQAAGTASYDSELKAPVATGTCMNCLHHLSLALRFRGLQHWFQPLVEPIAEPRWQFEDPAICYQNHHIPRRIKHGRTNFAGLKVLVDVRTQSRVYIAVDIGGDVLPNVLAVDSHLPRPNNPRFGANDFSLCASLRCKSALARCKRTFTDPSVIPKAAAVSFTSISSMSLSITALR